MTGPTDRPVVIFAMEWVPQYRVRFYRRLQRVLADRGVDMRLLHGDPPASRSRRNDSGVLDGEDWVRRVPNREWTIKGLEVTAQPVLRQLRRADLVILQQETGLLLNYLMLVRSRLGGPRVGLWGHGENFNPREANPLAERVKAAVTRWADWAFAYTDRSADVFASIGVDPARLTVVQNSADTEPLRNPTGPVSDDVAALVDRLRSDRAQVGWIVSALDRWKRVPFLIEVLDACAATIDGFAFVALGAGDQADLLVDAARTRPWLHPLGARFGADKAAIGALASLTIHPGLVGLHVIEAFATESPMITADLDYHSHEISYLSDDNSLVLAADASAQDFAKAAQRLLSDGDELDRLRAGCRVASDRFTLEAMVDNFAAGVIDALTTYRLR